MAVSYEKLWKLISEKNMSQSELSSATRISRSTIFRMRNNERVTMYVMGRICEALDCDVPDILEYVDD